jgi:hypothetical protein
LKTRAFAVRIWGAFQRGRVIPTDTVDLPRERNEVIKLRDVDIKRCFEEFRKWGNSRMERLKAEGYKKART